MPLPDVAPAVRSALSVILPPYKAMGPAMLIAEPTVTACVFVLLPKVKPVSVLAKL
ncbi:hypothetical protein LTEGF4_12490 [Limnohabitans sp. TEGF004]|nr:hypothetical protein LTEGF4_12490 [Limnohabitans sp. TEGF004]